MAYLAITGTSPERISVKQYGAVGDGVVDDTAAFEAAVAAAPAVNNISGNEGANIPRAPMCIIRIPDGTYSITSEIDTGGKEIVWEMDQSATVSDHDLLNGKVIRKGQKQNDYHHGTVDYACNYSIRSNVGLEANAEVVGIDNESGLASYPDRDSVSLFVDNTGPAPLVDVATATYTATTVTIAAPSASVLKKLRKGMIIDTKHSTKWSAFIDSWNEDGSVITVNNWYQSGGGGTPSTPTGTDGLYINGITKIWAQNSNVTLSGTSHATRAAGFELGVLNNKGTLNFAAQTNYMVAYDAVTLGTYNGAIGFTARASASSKFHRGFNCSDAAEAGYRIAGTPTHGFWSEQTSGSPFSYTPSGVTKFQVTSSGSVNILASNGSVSLGDTSASNTPFIDFNSSGNSIDYDVRIMASGGTASAGNGALTVTAAGGFITSGTVRANTDNTRDCGGSTFRWSNVYGNQFRPGGGTPIWTSGSGTPEGNVTAVVGSLYTRTDGGASTTLYVKESGTGNTGWIAK